MEWPMLMNDKVHPTISETKNFRADRQMNGRSQQMVLLVQISSPQHIYIDSYRLCIDPRNQPVFSRYLQFHFSQQEFFKSQLFYFNH